MLELFLSLLAIVFIPLLSTSYVPGAKDAGFIMLTVYYTIGIVLVTMIANIIRAIRYCKEKSWGITYGFKKGLTAGIVAIALLLLIKFNPEFGEPIQVLTKVVPSLGAQVNGLILSVGYLLGYLLLAYPIWGGTC
jgi:hypothetical protein